VGVAPRRLPAAQEHGAGAADRRPPRGQRAGELRHVRPAVEHVRGGGELAGGGAGAGDDEGERHPEGARVQRRGGGAAGGGVRGRGPEPPARGGDLRQAGGGERHGAGARARAADRAGAARPRRRRHGGQGAGAGGAQREAGAGVRPHQHAARDGDQDRQEPPGVRRLPRRAEAGVGGDGEEDRVQGQEQVPPFRRRVMHVWGLLVRMAMQDGS